MKSLYISYDGALESLGHSQITPYLKELSKSGLSFVLLTFDKNYFVDKEEKQELRKELEMKNIKWLSLRYHKRPLILSTIFDIIKGLMVSIIIVRQDNIEVVHARGYVAASISLCLKKIFKIKFIFDMRGFWADEKAECNHWNKKSILYKFTKYLEGQFIENADELIVLTQKAKLIIENQWHNSSRISVIPCCVDIDTFKSDIAIQAEFKKKNNLSGKFVFAYTGSLEAWYMKSEMLDYFKIAKKLAPNAHFLILSQSPKEEILNLILKKQLSRDDFTLISATFKEMPKYLSLVDAGIIFLSLGFSKLACFPTKFAEFLSCGIPVISNNGIGDIDEIIVNYKLGIVVNHFNEDEYRRTFLELLKIMDDNHLKLRCRNVAQELFSLDMGVDRYKSIYLRLKNELYS